MDQFHNVVWINDFFLIFIHRICSESNLPDQFENDTDQIQNGRRLLFFAYNCDCVIADFSYTF